jgi:hypothetical protein
MNSVFDLLLVRGIARPSFCGIALGFRRYRARHRLEERGIDGVVVSFLGIGD